ncbi:voltage-dependent anion channel-domain-containing protein [Truncatella angustata]|uniref:Voltage-dependent anion channel-domain-containing protein n=1 Tax=Truncatella angustata TaxID=152316 RepID=A0A9P8UPS4_9PEZI|nr:voltage-dependent anion channel-domain-containing protein [Truncatella angustata]KAH6656680.1 voltage-dependent anion channel-domain-containing protein [Truncatella angustata]
MSRLVVSEPAPAFNGYVTPREEQYTAGVSPGESSSPQGKRAFAAQQQQHPNAESLARMIAAARRPSYAGKVGIRDRISCYQWTWFTMTMATGGIANVLHTIPLRSDWLYYIGLVVFLFNICLFLLNCTLISLRFSLVPGSFMHSFLDQTESLFIPAVLVSWAIILINICEYGIPYCGLWLQRVVQILFWMYVAVSFTSSAAMYLTLWSTQIFPIHRMTPVWVFPAYPLLLVAPFASNLIKAAAQSQAGVLVNFTAIAFCAVTIQGTGFLISFMVCAAFLYRLMTQKLPRDIQRPGVFISIGPSGFTCAGLVALGNQSDIIVPSDVPGREHAVYILQILSLMLGLWLWGLSLWFFLVSVGSLHKYLRREHKIPFQMTWWSFVFPNTALVTATFALADVLNNTGLKIFGCVMACLLILVWLLVFIRMMKGLRKREILWPKGLEAG